MALIDNKYYIFVEEEEATLSANVTQHPVETGIKVTDNVKQQPITLTVSGKIVAVGDTSATTIREALRQLNQYGIVVRYQGVHILPEAVISNLKTKATAEISGGYDFEMDLTQIRIVKSAYKAAAKTATTTKQVTTKKTTTTTTKKAEPAKRYYTVKTGDCPWSIAVKYYNNGTKWEQMMKANTDIIARNKKWGVLWYAVYTGDKLLIPYL